MTDTVNKEKDAEIRKAAVPVGLILGVVSLVMGIFSFYFITGMTSSMLLILFSPLIFSIVIPLIIAIFFTLDLRKKIGGYWNFKQATSGIFVMLLISIIVSTIGTQFLFGKLIEPDMTGKTKVAMVNAVTTMMEKAGSEQSQIDKTVEDMEKKIDEQADLSIGKFALNLGISIIFAFIIALIFAAIFKKEPPRYLQDYDAEPAV